MSRPPRLTGPTVSLLPVPHPVAVDVVAGRSPDLAALGLRACPGWPHAATPDALRPLADHGADGDAGTWLVVHQGEVVGDCGWRGGPDADGAVEVHYGLAAPRRRRGLGTEAVAVLVAWAEQQPGVALVTAEVQVGNEASLRLLARLGFSEQGSHPPYLRLVRAAPGRPRPRGRHVC